MIRKYLQLHQVTDGECLYHYTRCTSLLNILKTQKFFATKSSFLNDTKEMDYILHVTAAVVNELESESWRDLLTQQVVNTLEEMKRHDTFVLSLSTDQDSITLWAEFGEQTGYSVAFDGPELIRRISTNQDIYCHGSVIYSAQLQHDLVSSLLMRTIPDRIGISFSDIMEQAVSGSNESPFQELCRRMQKMLNAYAMFFKQEEFAPEEEYRLVFRNPDKKKILYREKDGFPLPYIEIDLSGKGSMPLSSVTVAPKNHVDLAQKGMLQYLQQLGYDVPVELSRLKLRY